MSLQIRPILQVLAILSLMVSIAWMALRPGFDSLITLLGTISATLTLIFSDQSKSSDKYHQHTYKPSNDQPSGSYIPQQSESSPVFNEQKSDSDYVANAFLLMYAGCAIIGGIIGFIIGLPKGAISAVLSAGAGTVAGLFVGFGIGLVIGYTVIALQILWFTKWFWLFVGILLAVGYMISGRL